MNSEHSRTLNIGDRVDWHPDKNDVGTVTEQNPEQVTIRWDNGKVQTILHDDMGEVFLVPGGNTWGGGAELI